MTLPAGSAPGVPPRLLGALADAGVAVTTDPDVCATHGTDWTGRWTGPVLAVARPRSTEQVAAVLACAGRDGVPVQVQGGNTGLVGGSVPDRPSLVLSTTGLVGMGEVDPVARTVVVAAGVTAARTDGAARAAGLRLGVDLAARDSATVGGMVATNAGGIAVLAHGMMREQVRGVTAVLADGRVVDTTGRPRKDNAGYDLAGLLVGSEGTLGVITAVELALHPDPGPTTVGVLAVPRLSAAVAAARRVQSAGVRLLAAEVVDDTGTRAGAGLLGRPDPLGGRDGWMLLLEVADGGTGRGLEPVGDDVLAMATQPGDRARLWAIREEQSSLYARAAGAGLAKLDVSVRLGALDDLVSRLRGCCGDRARLGVFGHALDGNLHVQVVPPPGRGPDDRIVTELLTEVARAGGAISAEHGIGRAKAGLLGLVRDPAEIAWMRQLRATVDPAGMLNPGVLLG